MAEIDDRRAPVRSPGLVRPARGDVSGDQMAAAYAELSNLLVHGPDVTAFLERVAVLSTRVLDPPASCGITLRRNDEVATIANTDELSAHADEVQYGQGEGPCLQCLRDRTQIHVPDLAADDRWDHYREHATKYGVASSLSLPLVVNNEAVGALNLYADRPHRFTDAERRQAEAFAEQAATLLTIVLNQARQSEISERLERALVSRAAIDQAMGIVMAQQRCTPAEAFDLLRSTAQHRNRQLAEVAAELIEATTGHPPQPPRPFLDRR